MRRVLFFSRVAFVCNCFFVLALSLQFARWFQNQDAESLVIIMGYFMAVMLNFALLITYLFLFVKDKTRLRLVPKWLMIANLLFLIFQFVYIIHLNGQ